MVFYNIIKTVMAEIKDIAKTETVVGKPVEAGNSTIIPVSRISFGFGGGGGGGKNSKENSSKQDAEGTGIAGGAKIEPVAFIVITDGKAQMLSVDDKSSNFTRVIDIIPDVIAKFAKEKAGDEKKE